MHRVQQRMTGEGAEEASTVWGHFLKVKTLQSLCVLMGSGFIEKRESSCRGEEMVASVILMKLKAWL